MGGVGGPLRRMVRTGALGLGMALAAAPAAAQAEEVLGIPCVAQADGVRICTGSIEHRVRTWDGIPLDVDVVLPPAKRKGPFPAIFTLHGFGGSKGGSDLALAREGYVLVQYSARGFGMSCGLPVSRGDAKCARGWSHLADIRYEPRDTQHLAGLLADTGLVDGRRIGVTGTSFGAGQSLLLATLKDRVVLEDGRFVRWRSPQGRPMRIAAAAPNWPWSDLAAMLVPNGTTLDYRVANPYGERIGVPKLSYVGMLTVVGGGPGYFAPPGVEFSSDAFGWVGRFVAGDPWRDVHRAIIDEIATRHSPMALRTRFPRRRPAPVFANASWADDLTTPTEILRWRSDVLATFPDAVVDVLLSDGAGHPRAGLLSETPGLTALQRRFWDRHLKGVRTRSLGVRTSTMSCAGNPAQGPFTTRTWGAQHPGEVRFRAPGEQVVPWLGEPASGAATDPVASVITTKCAAVPAVDSPASATYRLPVATGSGLTLLGSPTVAARLLTRDVSAQIAARLWDVAPNGRQTLVARVAYRPRVGDRGRQVFQLHPTGWHVRPGHAVKLELLGADAPYVRPSNVPFTVTVSDLELRLPVRQRPGTGPVQAPARFLAPDGSVLPARQRVRDALPPAAPRR